MGDWPFADPRNLASISVRQIIHDGNPVLLVSHDADDGGWQFLTGGAFEIADAMLVSLESMLERDPSLAVLCDLPLGWRAWRDTAAAPWQRGPNSETD